MFLWDLFRKMSNKSPFVTPKTRHSDKVISQTLGNGNKKLTKTPDCFKPTLLGTPTVGLSVKKSNLNGSCNESQLEKSVEENTSIVVAVRVRPLSANELTDPKVRVSVVSDGNSITVQHGEHRNSLSTHNFTFDHCFWSLDDQHEQFADQSYVYQTVGSQLLQSAFEGYNTCLFAYGQTGSGKSYSIMGSQTDEGIIPRFGRDLFHKINSNINKSEKWCVEISFFEIYNEKIHDLLASSPDIGKKAAMRVREHPILGPYVEDLATFIVSTYDDFARWLSFGNKQRATAATGFNEKSSRSHSTLTVVISRTKTEYIEGKPRETSRKSKVNIVDLAGSERVGMHSGLENRVKEGVSINKSLLTLGKVISQLAETVSNNKKMFVPYRDSVLTWLLKESLGGNSKTTMLATVSPSSTHVEETLSTLRYAGKARNIVNVARVNEDPNMRLIRELRNEIDVLRNTHDSVTHDENKILRERVGELESLLELALKTKEEKLDQAKKCQAEKAESLQKAGISFEVDKKLIRLINLNQDPQLSETLNYIIRDGVTCVGQLPESSQNKVIQLNGSLIENKHCLINNKDGIVHITPCESAPTYVNGFQIKNETQLYHGDRIIIGGQHYFRFISPLQSKKDVDGDKRKDFVFAQTEFLKVQEQKMEQELTKEREKIRKEMLEEIESIKKEHELAMNFQRDDFENHIERLNNALEIKDQEFEIAQRSPIKVADISLDETFCDNLEPMQTDFLKKIEECFSSDFNIQKTNRPLIDIPKGTSLYWLSTMIRETNRTFQKLEMNFECCQHDRLTESLNFELTIKVRDMINKKKVEWDVPKFTQKIETLRNLKSDEKDILFDSEDVWEDDEDSPASFSPKIVDSFLAAYEAVENVSLNATEFNGSPNTSKYLRNGLIWNKIQLQQKDLSFSSRSPPHKKLAESFISHSKTLIQCFKEITSSSTNGQEFEHLLNEFSRLYKVVSALNNSDSSQTYNLIATLNSCMTTIVLMATKIVTLFLLRSNNSNNLGSEFKDEVESLCNLIVGLIQEMMAGHNDIISLELNTKLFKCCFLSGKIVASLGICLSDNVKMEIDLEKHLVSGLLSITLKALQTVMLELEDLELRLNVELENYSISSPKLPKENNVLADWHKIVNVIRKWAGNFQKFQLSVKDIAADTNELASETSGFKSLHSQQIILNFSSLIDNIMAINDVCLAHLDGNGGKESKASGGIDKFVDNILQNMGSLISVNCVCTRGVKEKTETIQEELLQNLECIKVILNKFQQKLHRILTTGKHRGSPISHTKRDPEKRVQKLNSDSETKPKTEAPSKPPRYLNGGVSKVDTVALLENIHSPVSVVGTPDSMSQASTSIWTTKSTLSDSQNLDNTEWADFTIRI